MGGVEVKTTMTKVSYLERGGMRPPRPPPPPPPRSASENLKVSSLADVFIIFYNEYAITLNQRLCGFNCVVIFLIILVAFVLIVIIVRLHCHIEHRGYIGHPII